MKNKNHQHNAEKCLVCEGKLKYLLTGHDHLYKVTKNDFNVYQCSDCKLEQIVPMPASVELMNYYPSEYYSYNTFKKKNEMGILMRIREKIVEVAYFNNNARKDVLYILAILVRPFFRGLPLKRNGGNKFLDVGCGDGYNVALMTRCGWTATGFEIGVKKTNGNIIYDTDLFNVDFGSIKFDCIRVWHVLEHVSNPNQFMKKLKYLLADNGKILIGVPNTSSLCALFFGQFWYNRDLPRHVVNYGPTSLNRLLKDHGFMITELSYNSAGGFLASIQYVVNNYLKTDLRLVNNIILFIFFFPMDILLNILKWGDCISVIVEKDIYK